MPLAVSSYSIGTERRMESNKVIQNANGDHHSQLSNLKSDDNEETVYVISYNEEDEMDESSENEKDTRETIKSEHNHPLDPWSIVWYIGSFGALVAFFLIVSCSEWCCRRNGRSLTVPYAQRAEGTVRTPGVAETPPPPYHLFAPPSYDSVNYGQIVDKTSGEKVDVYVISVPIHRPVAQGAPA
ncbi:uncharacterized protein LOC109856509 isoform X2 [Pseudomyrmex gracilis]|uniref:uncharacterized protein LOC109856509 isoform X2 n=1 Tax=Pseudomyrmex gracilis TaxID=219809 RepID=UPI0009958167|nr:uncharacterized protein LOC109856509 isoform X2 [Pseudomyrmex gracilis]